jgi:hypothetical protein
MTYFEKILNFEILKTSVDGCAALDEGLDEGCKLDISGTESAALVGSERYLHLQNSI